MMKNVLIFLALILVFPLITKAQTPDISGGVNSIILGGIFITITPNVPGPNQQVQARLESSTIDLDASDITWSINGQVIQQGRGVKSINFTTGNIGSQNKISVSIKSAEGTFNQTKTIEVGSVDLLWQGIGYTPPFYKGRTLWSNQSGVTLMAIPHISGNVNNAVYTWSIDDKILGNSSGVGKNSLTFVGSILGLPKIVKVEIADEQGSIIAMNSIKLSPFPSRVLIYEDSPLYGLVFNHESSSGFSLNTKEVSFVAMPLFFSSPFRDSSQFSYSWDVNGNSFGQTGSRITFRVPDNTKGESLVGISIKNSNRLLQSIRKTFGVQFNSQTNL